MDKNLMEIQAPFDQLPDLDLSGSGPSIKGTLKALGSGADTLWKVDPAQIERLENFNVRIRTPRYLAHLDAVRESIRAEGFHLDKPLSCIVTWKVVNGESVPILGLTGGYTRHEAVMQLIEEGVPIVRVPVVVTPGVGIEALTARLISGNNQLQLEPFEQAIVCQRMIGYGKTVEEVAAEVRLPVSTVESHLVLVGAHKKIRQMVIDGIISPTLAVEMIKKHGANALKAIESAYGLAKESGKDKVTKRFAPGNHFKRVITKTAKPMYEAITALRSEPVYQSLSPELLKKFEALFTELEDAKQKDPTGAADGTAVNANQLPLGGLDA